MQHWQDARVTSEHPQRQGMKGGLNMKSRVILCGLSFALTCAYPLSLADRRSMDDFERAFMIQSIDAESLPASQTAPHDRWPGGLHLTEEPQWVLLAVARLRLGAK
ncbi:hypothetical protein D7S89_16355 [Trinickia fusca]|uniref:Uncharacterized protein n=1 Tax=Trinickia fusca TaxID=2419777 RepID=A0A494X8X9_9BURK|nr:hypothetical protein D7S89_16355 [Trinickia fusca]